MIRVTGIVLSTVLFTGAAGGAYAQQAQQPGVASAPQVSALPRVKMEPKPSGGENTESTHFIKPPGYDQNRSNYPYGPGSGPKPD